MDTTKNLVLVFDTESSKSKSFTISNVKPDLSAAQAQAIADILLKNTEIFAQAEGNLTELLSAKIVTTEKTLTVKIEG